MTRSGRSPRVYPEQDVAAGPLTSTTDCFALRARSVLHSPECVHTRPQGACAPLERRVARGRRETAREGPSPGEVTDLAVPCPCRGAAVSRAVDGRRTRRCLAVFRRAPAFALQ